MFSTAQVLKETVGELYMTQTFIDPPVQMDFFIIMHSTVLCESKQFSVQI